MTGLVLTANLVALLVAVLATVLAWVRQPRKVLGPAYSAALVILVACQTVIGLRPAVLSVDLVVAPSAVASIILGLRHRPRVANSCVECPFVQQSLQLRPREQPGDDDC